RAGIPNAPEREIEHEAGQVRLHNLGPIEGMKGGRLALVPKTVADTGCDATRPRAALVGARARHLYGLEPGDARGRVVARTAGKTAVDDDAHIGNGEARFGDRGRQDDLPATD